jgi:Tfp pilus assembly protein PilN
MIRINLLPQKRAKRAREPRTPGMREVWVGAGVLAAIAVLFVFTVDRPKRKRLAELRASNAQIQQDIAAKHAQLKGYAELKKAADEADERAKSINHLASAKVVPANVLQELGQILTAGQLPTMTKEMAKRTDSDPNRRFDLAWDPQHVWLTGYSDKGGTFKLEGGAQAEVDVTQLSKRLQASVYFMDVAPSSETRVADRDTGIEYYRFTITGKVAY